MDGMNEIETVGWKGEDVLVLNSTENETQYDQFGTYEN